MKSTISNLFFISILILFLSINQIKAGDFDDFESFENYGYNEDPNSLNIASISYDLTYDETSVVKVTIKTYYELSKNVKFKAFLKTDDELREHILQCQNEFVDLISCTTSKNITLDTQKKYFFYYNKKKSGSNITFDGEDTFEDENRISLIFSPVIDDGQILYKDHRTFDVKNDNNMVSGGYLYITKKSKKVLQERKNFNKNIDLNNFISHCGLWGYRPQNTLVAFKEAIRRGYKIVDGDLVFTKDKIPVMCHGVQLNLVSNGHGDLNEKTYDELKKLDFGSIFDPKYKGEKILKFEDLLKLCKEEEIILDLDLGHIKDKYFENTDEYVKIIINLIEKYEMFNSIFINDGREQVIEKFKSLRNDIVFSVYGISSKENMEKMNKHFNNSEINIYNFGGLTTGGKISEETVKYGISLGKKIKASKIDDINFANQVVSWGVNYVCTNKLEPFLMKNEREEPIIATCTQSDMDEEVSECEIDEEYDLEDNQMYNIYYSTNIYNSSMDIVEKPIGEFKFVDTNLLDEYYYDINHFDFNNGIIKLNISNTLKKGETINGLVGPTYDDVAECYIYDFTCKGNGKHMLDCTINKKDPTKVPYNGDYKIYSLEGYSLNKEQLYYKLNYQKNMRRFKISILIIAIIVIISCAVIYFVRMRSTISYRRMNENADDFLFR